MRKYAKLGPTFWTGTTGKALRKAGPQALLVAAYLISAPSSNMLGLYYQPLLYMAHETGLGIEGASKGLTDCIACGFCSYDEGSEMVFVHEMAAWQIAPSLKPKDKRCAGIQRDYDALPENPFLGPWFDRYSEAFHLVRRRGPGSPPMPADTPDDPPPEMRPETSDQPKSASPLEAPSKPHRSQEQEQEHRNTEDYTERGVSVDNFPEPGPYGAAWAVLHGLGIVGASPGDPVFRAMVDKGVSCEEWRAAAEVALRQGHADVAYVVGVVKRKREAAAQVAVGLPSGPVVAVVPPAETAAQYAERMAAVRSAAKLTPEQRASNAAACQAAMARLGRHSKRAQAEGMVS